MTDAEPARAAARDADALRRPGHGSGWRIVAAQESTDLWVNGRGPLLLFVYSVLLSVISYLAATNEVLNFLEVRETVSLTLQVAVGVAVLVVLVAAADSISGERERGTLESILLTPVSRRGIVAGKLAAALTLWFAAWLVGVPYLWVLSQKVRILGQALALGFFVGTVLAVGMAAVGLLISAVSNSNKVSVATGLFLLLALFAPTQLPSGATHGTFSELLGRLNPVAAGLKYLSAVIVRGHSWTADLALLVSPVLTAVMATGILIAGAPRLVRLTAGGGRP